MLCVVTPTKVASMEHLAEQLERISEKKGEGLIFRRPGSKYLDRHSFFETTVRNEKSNAFSLGND